MKPASTFRLLPRAAALLLLAGLAHAEGLLEKFLAGPMKDSEEIVFAMRKLGHDGHWYANFSYYAADANRKAYGMGARLCRLNLRSGRVANLLDDPQGGVRDPQVSYDGRKIVFSYRKGGTDNYLLYEINTDGSGLKQLTTGDYDDFEPAYLPDGGIVFVSSRCKRWVNCWLTQVAIIHRCDADGGNIRALSSNNEQDNTPWPLPDGRILYTRWEYVDRSQVDYHHLWTMNPDGTSQMVYYGNLHPSILMIDAKPIPGTDKVVTVFSPGHGWREHDGEITVVDPKRGPDDLASVKRISKAGFRDPWAFSEDCFLAASGPSLVVMDGQGNQQKVFEVGEADRKAGLEAHEPRPVVGRETERLVHPRVDLAAGTGRLLLANAHVGRNMQGVKEGEIKKLLVMETLPMPIHYTGGMEPMSYGGTFTLERVVGTVPVEADGSAYFELPALRSFFFVALDQNDLAVKRMQSFVTVQPGEVTSCVGCHEQRTQAPGYRAKATLAFRRPASRIEPITDAPEVFDFPRDIQPILDRHCVGCHDYSPTNQSRVFLTGDRGPLYSHSYFALTARSQVADGRNLPRSNYAPRALGSAASPLMRKLEPGHHGVQVTPTEKKLVRLWIESGAAYPGTYAALGSGMIGSYEENQIGRPDLQWPATQAAEQALHRRCDSCHNEKLPLPMSASHEHIRPPWEFMDKDDARRRLSRHLLYNLSRPEKSMLVLAPLGRAAGGYELCRPKGADGNWARNTAPVFADTSDADYQAVLGGLTEASKHLNQIKRFDMAGFRPRVDWLREMKRYGILPRDLKPSDPVDYYAAEREYWRSLWYQPLPKAPQQARRD